MGEIFNTFLVFPIINILVAIYQALFLLNIPYALGFAIILLTVVIRLVLYPLISTQLKASKKMQELAPHLTKVKDKHKGDAKMIQSETMRLYKEHGVNPAAGCLPMLIQIPLLWALYSVLQKIVGLDSAHVVSEVNKILYDVDFLKLTQPWNATFFGISLAQTPSNLISITPLIVLVPVLTAVFQFIQSKMMLTKPVKLDAKKDGKEKEQKKDDFATAFQTQSLYIFPVMIGFFSFSFPIGLSLYWNTFTIFGILQQHRIQGWGGLSDWIEKLISLKKKT